MAGQETHFHRFVTIFFLTILLTFVPDLFEAKECTNVPTQRVSHTLRARSLNQLNLFSAFPQPHNLSDEIQPQKTDVPKEAPIISFRKFVNLGSPRKELYQDVEVEEVIPQPQLGSESNIKKFKEVPTHPEDKLADDVLVEIDDWAKAWATLMKALVKDLNSESSRVKSIPSNHLAVSRKDSANSENELYGIIQSYRLQFASENMNVDLVEQRRSLFSKTPVNTPKRSITGLLKDVSLHKVRLGPDSPQFVAQNTNLQYLLELDVDNLVWNFRKVATLASPGRAYGGWESPQSELRGHFVGHYLSATALMWASTHSDALLVKMKALVTALKECQLEMGTGYLSAFPPEFFDRVEAIQPVWAPYYTIHKIMAGLLDQYTFAENMDALDMAVAMAGYFNERVKRVIKQFTIERHWRSLNEESGGMNDVLYQLYTVTVYRGQVDGRITLEGHSKCIGTFTYMFPCCATQGLFVGTQGNEDHLNLAHLFDKPCFLGPLALQADHLSGFHTNTHIPVVVGAQKRYEVTGDQIYRSIAEYFMSVVNSSHSYATGGTSVSEFWMDPMRQGGTLQTENQETCTTYNMLKIARNLFRWTKEVAYMDYYERALVNGIMGVQRGQQPGVMIYMLPLGSGMSKARSYHGWGNKFDSFWCCYGTGVESFAKLGDSIYFEEEGEIPTIYVTQFVSNNFTWDAAGLTLRQMIEPFTSGDPVLRVTISIYLDETRLKKSETSIRVRIPSWTASLGCHAYLNGKEIQVPSPGNFLIVVREWASDDKLSVTLPMTLRTESIQDDRSEYSALRAIMFGPFVMAGLSSGDWRLGQTLDPTTPSKWMAPVPAEYFNQLHTFTQDQVSQGSSPLCMSHSNGMATMGAVPLDGTDAAGISTFRLADPLTDAVQSTSKTGRRVVSLELFSEPGRYLAHNGEDSAITIMDAFKSKSSLTFSKDSKLDIFVPPNFVGDPQTEPRLAVDTTALHKKNSSVNWHSRVADSVFKFLSGLSGNEGTVSFEAVSKPGCFLSSQSDGVSGVGGISLRCRNTSSDPNFDALSTFNVGTGLASYHPISFVAKGEFRNFLFAPLNAYRDESYAIYFGIK